MTIAPAARLKPSRVTVCAEAVLKVIAIAAVFVLTASLLVEL